MTSSLSKAGKNSVKYIFYEKVCDILEKGKSDIVYNHRDRSNKVEYNKGFEKFFEIINDRIKILNYHLKGGILWQQEDLSSYQWQWEQLIY